MDFVVDLVAVHSALTYVSKLKIPVKYLITVYFILSLFIEQSLIVINVYAQQGGAATGESATSGNNVMVPPIVTAHVPFMVDLQQKVVLMQVYQTKTNHLKKILQQTALYVPRDLQVTLQQVRHLLQLQKKIVGNPNCQSQLYLHQQIFEHAGIYFTI